MATNEFEITTTGIGIIPREADCIPNGAFKDCTDLKVIVVPDKVTKIGESAFSGCTELRKVELPASFRSRVLSYIGSEAFFGCSKLEKIEINDSVLYLGSGAFQGCTNLKEVKLSKSITEINDDTFNGCSFASIKIPPSVERIGNYAFVDCNKLECVEIPYCVNEIGESAFAGCENLKCVEFVNYVKYGIGEGAFNRCPLKNIFVPVKTEDFFKKRLPEELHDLIVENELALENRRERNNIASAILSGLLASADYCSASQDKRDSIISTARAAIRDIYRAYDKIR